jgi:GNAT superfamily N-acetyltransferase
MAGYLVQSLEAGNWPALEELFGRSGASNGCWCAYWRIGPRYRDRPREDNRGDLRLLAESGQPGGLLAFTPLVAENVVKDNPARGSAVPESALSDGAGPPAGAAAVGWCSLAPRADLGWLAHARYLRPVDDVPAWSIPCFYIRRDHRGRGVTDALIVAALDVAAAAGAPALEAYPVDTEVPGHSRNAFTGTAATFARHGFRVVARRKPDRPIMRRVF